MVAAVCLVMFLAGCNNDSKRAGELFQRAELSFASGNYNLAKLQIDSIRTLYPKAVDVRKAGVRLMQQVDLHEQRKTLAYLDSMMQVKQAALDSIKDRFVLEKDTAYQEIGNYFYPTQVVEKNIGRSFLRAQVNELGEMLLTSIYCAGGSIHHTAVKVSTDGDLFAQTAPSPDSYETTDLGEHIEKADYKLKQDGGVIEFIALNPDKSLRVDFMGDRTYTTQLTKADKQAAGAILKLAEVLDSIAQVKHDMEECRLKIGFLEERIKRDSLETLNK